MTEPIDAIVLDREPPRREFLCYSTVAMAGGVLAGYGMLGVCALRYLYPTGSRAKIWMFVAEVRSLRSGDSLDFEAPTGAKIVIARRTETGRGKAADFVALSSVCPHLGCQVQWQAHKNRFYCPCHDGVFDPAGKARAGPPAKAGQSLAHYPLKVENGLLFIEVPVEGLGSPEEA